MLCAAVLLWSAAFLTAPATPAAEQRQAADKLPDLPDEVLAVLLPKGEGRPDRGAFRVRPPVHMTPADATGCRACWSICCFTSHIANEICRRFCWAAPLNQFEWVI